MPISLTRGSQIHLYNHLFDSLDFNSKYKKEREQPFTNISKIKLIKIPTSNNMLKLNSVTYLKQQLETPKTDGKLKNAINFEVSQLKSRNKNKDSFTRHTSQLTTQTDMYKSKSIPFPTINKRESLKLESKISVGISKNPKLGLIGSKALMDLKQMNQEKNKNVKNKNKNKIYFYHSEDRILNKQFNKTYYKDNKIHFNFNSKFYPKLKISRSKNFDRVEILSLNKNKSSSDEGIFSTFHNNLKLKTNKLNNMFKIDTN